jgi:16S rRNA (adenine1518-N6/adenine1519-N6)-dimethyltransferase
VLPALPPLRPALPPLREVIARHGLDARKSLGQHFLLDLNLTARIAALAGDLAACQAIEIGPGPGGLTRALLDTAADHVTAIELDRRAIAALTELQDLHPTRLTIIAADALTIDLARLVPAPRVIVANLPYNIATPLLIQWLRQAAAYRCLVLMFQLEVAQRITAAANTASYGRLSVLAQATCRTHLALRLPAAAFTPPPKVDSAVVVFTPLDSQPAPDLLSKLERVTAAAFGQRRKMLRGALRPLGGETLLARADIAPDRRAETLTVAEFLALARLI